MTTILTSFLMAALSFGFGWVDQAQASGCVAVDASIVETATLPGFIDPDPVIRDGTVTLESGIKVKIRGWNDASITGVSRFGYAIQTACDQTVSWTVVPSIKEDQNIDLENLQVRAGPTEEMVLLPEAPQFSEVAGTFSANLAGLTIAALPVGPKQYDLVAVRSNDARDDAFPALVNPVKIATVSADLAGLTQTAGIHGGRIIQFVTAPENGDTIGIFRVLYDP